MKGMVFGQRSGLRDVMVHSGIHIDRKGWVAGRGLHDFKRSHRNIKVSVFPVGSLFIRNT